MTIADGLGGWIQTEALGEPLQKDRAHVVVVPQAADRYLGTWLVAPGLRTEPLAAARRKAGGDAIAETALMFLGAPYEWGGVTVHGLDCSGLVQAVHRRFGLLLPHNAEQQESAGREVSLRQAQPGDLVCYGDHIAIWVGEGRIVHADQGARPRSVAAEPHRSRACKARAAHRLAARVRAAERTTDRSPTAGDRGRGRRRSQRPPARARRPRAAARGEHDQGARLGGPLERRLRRADRPRTRRVRPGTRRLPGGGGLLESMHPETELTLAELDLLMLAVSDNAATNAVIDAVGMDAVNDLAAALGLEHTRLRRRMMDVAAAERGEDNTTCAADMTGAPVRARPRRRHPRPGLPAGAGRAWPSRSTPTSSPATCRRRRAASWRRSRASSTPCATTSPSSTRASAGSRSPCSSAPAAAADGLARAAALAYRLVAAPVNARGLTSAASEAS